MASKHDLLEEDLLEETEDVTEEIQQEDTILEFGDEEEAAQHKGSDLIFPDGPTYDKLADWKARYNGEIYMSDFNDDIFIWRPLRRKEYRSMHRAEGKDEFYIEESITRTCVLWPEDYSRQSLIYGKAGIPTTLTALITERSGFSRPLNQKVAKEELEDMKDTDTLFDEGPSIKQVAEWFERHQGEVFISTFEDESYVWRPLRRKEYKDINRVDGEKNEFYVDESICSTCVLWPEEYGQHAMLFGKAGTPTTLANTITENSGFGRPMTYRMN